MNALTAINDRVIIKRAEPKTSEGSIALPVNYQVEPNSGEVVAVGPGYWSLGVFVGLSVTVGNKVFYDPTAGHLIDVDGVKYLVIRENDILAVVK